MTSPTQRELGRRVDGLDGGGDELPEAGLIAIVSTIVNDGHTFKMPDPAESVVVLDGEPHWVSERTLKRLCGDVEHRNVE